MRTGLGDVITKYTYDAMPIKEKESHVEPLNAYKYNDIPDSHIDQDLSFQKAYNKEEKIVPPETKVFTASNPKSTPKKMEFDFEFEGSNPKTNTNIFGAETVPNIEKNIPLKINLLDDDMLDFPSKDEKKSTNVEKTISSPKIIAKKEEQKSIETTQNNKDLPLLCELEEKKDAKKKEDGQPINKEVAFDFLFNDIKENKKVEPPKQIFDFEFCQAEHPKADPILFDFKFDKTPSPGPNLDKKEIKPSPQIAHKVDNSKLIPNNNSSTAKPSNCAMIDGFDFDFGDDSESKNAEISSTTESKQPKDPGK